MTFTNVGMIGHRVVKNAIRRCGTTGTTRSDPETHFGFERVKESQKGRKVYEVFENVSDKYDVMNDSMSLGLHRIWKDIFVARLAPTAGTELLDVAGGTGDIAFRYLKYLKNNNIQGNVTICDINKAMLDAGKRKYEQSKGINNDLVEWVIGDAEQLPFPDNRFTAYTIAFGIRNCTHIDRVLKEAYRVLKPGGRFLCLEFSHVPNPILSRIYDEYSFQVIPVLGQLIANQWRAYQYLVESIRQFPNQEQFKKIIETENFRSVTYENLTFGVVAMHSGFKL